LLKSAIERTLPTNYAFEIPKTIWRCREAEAKCVALQFPEGLLIYANAIADIVREFSQCERVIVLADVTYGACCVDDLTAKALGADFLVHYGHSCLVPASVTGPLKSLYVFVEISFDVDHLVGCVEAEFLRKRIGDGVADTKPQKLALAGTIQFATGVERARVLLAEKNEHVVVPQQLPLSAGEVLGCTSPRLPEDVDALVFVADGRFHLESLMIRNPHIPAFRYDPYSKRLTSEKYDTRQLHRLRRRAVAAAANASRVGLVLGALGRQGSPAILRRVRALLSERGIAHFCLILTEVTPDTLKRFDAHVDAWVQVACPRLSVDWGHHFSKPTLSPYEAHVAWGSEAWDDGHYPMDYYARSEKPWTNYFKGDAAK
jgi:2-(3-amino-3-carboxypropyl)histidine synthase